MNKNSNIPRIKSTERQTYGLNVSLLRKWQKERTQKLLDQEFARQEIAVAKVRSFLDAIHCIVRIQSWYRMLKPRHRYNIRKRAQRTVKYTYFRGIKLYWKSEKMFRVQIFGKFFIAWKDETQLSKDMQIIIQEFFKNCIQKLRLTPQACMAFFNQEKWSRSIAKSDMLKIRRLMLQKLFTGWRSETRDLSVMRYKASQVLSRMVRRTKGPLWVKESALVCFHMWFRYISVKKAYRLELPDPRYNNPFLPQWTKLFKEITVSRIKKKRTHELGKFLTQVRCYKKWRMLMTMDRSKPITPLAVAIMHYSLGLLRKVVKEWSELLRERGKMARFRDKIFLKWKLWAPHHRNMRLFQAKAIHLIRYRQMEHAYKIMVKICFNVIGKRTEKIKELRRNYCDRKVVLCAYALLHKNSHLVMVDCWRKLWYYWRKRRSWKALNWRFAYSWHMQRSKVLFGCWKEFVTMIKEERKPNNQIEITKPIEAIYTSSSNTTTKPALLTSNNSTESLSSDSSTDDDNEVFPTNNTTTSNKEEEQSLKSTHTVSILRKSLINRSRSVIQSSLSFTNIPSVNNHLNETNMKRRGAQPLIIEPDRDKLVRKFANIALALIEDGSSRGLQIAFENHSFQIFCLATVKAYNELLHISSTSVPSERSKNKQFSELVNVQVQESLQHGVDSANLKLVMEALSEGAIILPSHLRQVGRHIGDQYMPLFALLLLNSMLFFTERIVKEDYDAVINNIINPINAYLVATQLERWKKNTLTVRETSNLSQNTIVHNYITSSCTSKYMWRAIVLETIERKSKLQSNLCVELPLIHTVDDEVTEIYKRQKLLRLYDLRNSLASLVGIDNNDINNNNNNNNSKNINIIPPLIKPSPESLTKDLSNSYSSTTGSVIEENVSPFSQVNLISNNSKDIYTVLREYTLLTGKLATEAKALRTPLMDRDERLIVNGFLKQSHTDYLELRRLCMKNNNKSSTKSSQEVIKTKKKKRPNSSKKKKCKKNNDKVFKNIRGKTKLQDIFNTLLKEDLDQPILECIEEEDADDYSTNTGCGGTTTDVSSAGEDNIQEEQNNHKVKKLLRTTLRKYSILSFLQENIQEEEDLKKETEFQERVVAFNYHNNAPLLIEIWQPKIWKVFLNSSQAELVKSSYSCWNINAAQSVIIRIFFSLNSDSTISPFPEYNNIRSDPKIGSYGMWLINHVLGNEACRLSPTWTILPSDYWNFENIANQFSIELAFIAGTISGMKSNLDESIQNNDIIDKDLLTYQNFLKHTRKYIMDISDKRFTKHDTDKLERILFISQGKKIDVKMKTKQLLIHNLQEKITTSNVLVATGNLNGAAELFVLKPDLIDTTTIVSGKSIITSPSQKNKLKGTKKNSSEVVAEVEVSYDYATIHGIMTDVQDDIDRIKNEILDLQSIRKEGENAIRLFDWQCQRTTRMLKDLAAGHFETMVDVQAIAIRENTRLKDSENKTNSEIQRIRSILRYQNSINNFLTGNLESRKLQLKHEAEQKKISDLLYRKNSTTNNNTNSTCVGDNLNNIITTPLGKGNWQKLKKMNNLNNISNYENNDNNNNGTLNDGKVNSLNNNIIDPSTIIVADKKISKVKDKILGSGLTSPSMNSFISTTVHLMHSQQSINNTHNFPQKSLTIDEELALAHYNSAENVKKREDELKRLAEEQAEEMIANDLRLRLFDEYWSALPNKLHERRGSVYADNDNINNEMDLQEVLNIEEPQIDIPTLLQNRTEKIWESIGKQYWRTKEHFIRTMVNHGEDTEEKEVLKNILEAFRPIDPLDLIIQEPSKMKSIMKTMKVIDYNDEIDDDSTGCGGSSIRSIGKFDNSSLHANQIRLFSETMSEETNGNIWKSNVPPEFVKMMSVSMKQQVQADKSNVHMETMSSPSRAATASSSQGRGDLLQTFNEDDGTTSSLDSKPKPDPFSIIGKGEYLKFQFGMFTKAVTSVGGDSAGIEYDNASLDSFITNKESNIVNKDVIINIEGYLLDNVVNTQDIVDNFEVLSQTSSALHSFQVKHYLDLIDEPSDNNNNSIGDEITNKHEYDIKSNINLNDDDDGYVKGGNVFLDLMNQSNAATNTIVSPNIAALDLMLLKTNKLMNNIVTALIEEETASVIASIHSDVLSNVDGNDMINAANINPGSFMRTTTILQEKKLYNRLSTPPHKVVITKSYEEKPQVAGKHYSGIEDFSNLAMLQYNVIATGGGVIAADDTTNCDNVSVTSDVSMDLDLQQLGLRSNVVTKQKDNIIISSHHSSSAIANNVTNNNSTSKFYSDRTSKQLYMINNEVQNKISTTNRGTTSLVIPEENLMAVTIGGQWYMQPSSVVTNTSFHKERAVSPTQFAHFLSTVSTATTNTGANGPTTSFLESDKNLELKGKKLSWMKRSFTPIVMSDEILDTRQEEKGKEEMEENRGGVNETLSQRRVQVTTPHRLATELGIGLEDSMISGIYSRSSEDLQNLVKEFSIEKEREEFKRLKLEEQTKLSFFPPHFRQFKITSSLNNNSLPHINHNNNISSGNNSDMHLLLNSVLEDSNPNGGSGKMKKVNFFDKNDSSKVNKDDDNDDSSLVNKVSENKMILSSKMKYMLTHKDLYNPNELRSELMNNMLLIHSEIEDNIAAVPAVIGSINHSASIVSESAAEVATELRKYMKSRELTAKISSNYKVTSGNLSKNTTTLSDNYRIAINLRNESSKLQLKNNISIQSNNSSSAVHIFCHNDKQVTNGSTSHFATNSNDIRKCIEDIIIQKEEIPHIIEQSSSPKFWVDIEKKSPLSSPNPNHIVSSSPQISQAIDNEDKGQEVVVENRRLHKPDNNSDNLFIDDSIVDGGGDSLINMDDSQSLIDDFSILDMNEIKYTQDEFQDNNNNNKNSSFDTHSSILGNTDSIDIDDPRNLTRLSHRDLNGRNSSPLNFTRYAPQQNINHSPVKISINAKKIKHPINEILKDTEIYRPRTPIKTLTKINKSVASSIILEADHLTKLLNITSNKNDKTIMKGIRPKCSKNKTLLDTIKNSKSDGQFLKPSSSILLIKEQSPLNKRPIGKLQIITNNDIISNNFNNNNNSTVNVKNESKKIIDEIAKIEYPYFYSDDLIENNPIKQQQQKQYIFSNNKSFLNTKNINNNNDSNNYHLLIDTPTLNLKITSNPIEPPIPPQYLTATTASNILDNEIIHKSIPYSNTNYTNKSLNTITNYNPNHNSIEFKNNIQPKDNKDNIKFKTITNINFKSNKQKPSINENEVQKYFNFQGLKELIQINNISPPVDNNPSIKGRTGINIPNNNHAELSQSNSLYNNDEDEIEKELRDILKEEHRKDDEEAYRKQYYDKHKQHLYTNNTDPSAIPFKVGGPNVFTPIETGYFGGSTKLHVYKGFVRNNNSRNNNDDDDNNNSLHLPPIDFTCMNKSNSGKTLNDTLFTQKIVKTTKKHENIISPATKLLQKYLNNTPTVEKTSSNLNPVENNVMNDNIDDFMLYIATNITNTTNKEMMDINMKGSFNSISTSKSNKLNKKDDDIIPTSNDNSSINSNNSREEIENISTNHSSFWKQGNIDIVQQQINISKSQKNKRKKLVDH